MKILFCHTNLRLIIRESHAQIFRPNFIFTLVFFFNFRSALQMSMSESNQLKPGQLISTPSKSNSEFDQMFNGLGLGSYVSSKETAGSLATQENNQQNSMASNPAQPKQHLTLADKQKLLRQSETASKMAKQPQLQPNLGGMNSNSKPMGSMSKDLSSTLNSNLNQFQIQPQVVFSRFD